MPAKSKKQQRFFGIVHALQKGDIDNSDVSDKVVNVANKISKKDAKDFAKTKHKGLQNKMKKEMNETTSYTKMGVKFNFDGITWQVIKVGQTSSRARALTKSVRGTEAREFDNKIINKNKISENIKELKFRQIIREQIKNILSEEYTELMRINSKDIEQIITKYKKWEKASFENYGDFENKKTGESWNTKDAKIEILEFVYKQLNMISENNDKIIIK